MGEFYIHELGQEFINTFLLFQFESYEKYFQVAPGSP